MWNPERNVQELILRELKKLNAVQYNAGGIAAKSTVFNSRYTYVPGTDQLNPVVYEAWLRFSDRFLINKVIASIYDDVTVLDYGYVFNFGSPVLPSDAVDLFKQPCEIVSPSFAGTVVDNSNIRYARGTGTDIEHSAIILVEPGKSYRVQIQGIGNYIAGDNYRVDLQLHMQTWHID